MTFVFAGFRQANSVRHFSFDRVADDRTRTRITVGADLAVARKHEILLQDLPLLCQRLLEAAELDGAKASHILTEANMAAVENAIKAAKADKKPRRFTPSNRTGHAWRAPETVPAV